MLLSLLLLLFSGGSGSEYESISSSSGEQCPPAVTTAGAVDIVGEDDVLPSLGCSTPPIDDITGLTDNTTAGSFTNRTGETGESLPVEEAACLLAEKFFTVKK